MLSLAMALALSVQAQSIDVTPGRCIAAIDQFGPEILPGLRRMLEEDDKLARSGGTPKYDDAKRAAFFRMLERDEAAYATTVQRYRGVKPSDDDGAAIAALSKGSEILAVIRKCGEAQ